MIQPINVISLGAGVQSSTMALMAARGEITPMPSAAIFADTKCEPLEIYQWLDWLEKQLPFPVHRVSHKRGLLHNVMKSLKGGRFAGAPFFTESESARGGGKLRRQCTREFKIMPITKKLRELIGVCYRQRGGKDVRIVQWIGISLDEAIFRMKPSRTKYIEHIWPLVERRMTRWDCLLWMERNGYPEPPRSACTFCPYHSDSEWRRLKADPRSWKQIVAVDTAIRKGVRGTKERLYLHPSMKPITEVDFATEEQRGQTNLFDNQCEGMCGV
jgi:hypothetical protein